MRPCAPRCWRRSPCARWWTWGPAFHDTQVHTCISVWSSPREAQQPAVSLHREGQRYPLRPQAPEWLLTPVSTRAEALERRWRAEGEPLTQLVPVSLPGVKTRFDELLVDEDPERLLARLADFARTPPEGLEHFARRHGLPGSLLPKLRALKAGGPVQVDAAHLRPFFRYRGAHHRGSVPARGARLVLPGPPPHPARGPPAARRVRSRTPSR